ncbi:MAG TPA: glycosyltransferase, partial [Syntrophorhabdus sp.]|nr:glycosyltransferase [Syntrophorhabdus sp.]
LNNMLGSQLAGMIAAKMLGVPCVAHMRDFEDTGLLKKLHAKLVDHHIAISSAIHQRILELGVPPDKISTIVNAVDLNEFDETVPFEHLREEFGLEENEKTFGLFGRIMWWKGTKEFVKAAAIIFQQYPNARAFIVGSPSDGSHAYLNEVKSLVGSLGLDNKIIFTGFREDVPALMRMMDIIVHTSLTPEPFGRVIIEGMAMKKPIVATRAGGPLDIVSDGETGFLVPMNESEAMAERIVQLLSDATLSAAMGLRGRERIEKRFCKEVYAREIEKVYDQYAGRAKGKRRIGIKKYIPRTVKRTVKLFMKNIIDTLKYRISYWRKPEGLKGIKHVVFVCKGNICRSAFAEYILKKMKPGMVIESCGITCDQGNAPPLQAIIIAKNYQVDLSSHRSQTINYSAIDQADMIIAMEFDQYCDLQKMFPEIKDKIRLLRDFNTFPDSLLCNINDPYGCEPSEFDKCFSLIMRSVKSLYRSLGLE